MLVFIICGIIFVSLGIIEYLKRNNHANFFVNNRQSGTILCSSSLVASCIGGSATVGLISLAYKNGFPAFWFLGVGVIGLLFLGFFFAKKIRKTQAFTMPEILNEIAGPNVRTIASLIIIFFFLGILAAQFKALIEIVSAMTGMSNNFALWCGAALVIAYSMLGGQAAIIKSDFYQFFIIFIGIFTMAIWLFIETKPLNISNFQIFNQEINFKKFIDYLIFIGGSYVVGPMLFGILLSTKTEKVSKNSTIVASIIILLLAIAITCIGILIQNFKIENDEQIINALISNVPQWLGILFLTILFCAIISSADSCLITVSTIFTNDLLKTNNLKLCRLITVLIGIIGVLLTYLNISIIDWIFIAYKIYICGVGVPIFIGLMLYNKYKIKERSFIFAMLCGSFLSLFAIFSDFNILNYLAILISAIICFSSIKKMNVVVNN